MRSPRSTDIAPVLLWLAGALVAPAAAAPDAGAVLDAARAVLPRDPWPTLITVDDAGMPRARTVAASTLDTDGDDTVVWVATNPASRKVAQLRGNPRATLHWTDDDAGAYVSLMATATLHDDAATLAEHTFTSPADLAAFWPDYPRGYLLIRLRAERIEVLGGAVPGAALGSDPVTWAPVGADLD